LLIWLEPFHGNSYLLITAFGLVANALFVNNTVEEDCRMKRQKRDRLERAHAQGYRAGVTGRSKEICPYQNLDARSQWLGGYREAMEDRGGGLFSKGQ
jgi:ribosome modulation factor